MTDHNSDTDMQKDAAPQGQGRKLLLDLGPLVVFFATNYITGDFMLAVGLLVAATVVALAAGWMLERRISMICLLYTSPSPRD